MKEVEGKVALITGGAKGIGLAAAEVLGTEGARILITDIDEADGRKALTSLKAKGVEARFCVHDVSREAEWEGAIAETLKAFGRLDILVNNAGVASALGRIEETELAAWRGLMAINLDGVFLGVKHAIRAMKADGGAIINISSIMGIVGNSGSAAYNSSKGGVRLLTKCAALECAEAGYKIRVNSVHPGYIDTPMVRGAVQTMAQLGSMPSVDAGYEMLRLLHPVGHLGRPADIANAILFLASERSAFMTGAELVVDGGYTAR